MSESERIDAARQFAIEAARLAANTHCENVVLLDVRGLSPITDFFIIATGTSSRQMRAVADEVYEMAKTSSHRPLSSSGMEGSSWILVDFVDSVLHLFSAEARLYYDLDNLWGDARRVDWTQTERR